LSYVASVHALFDELQEKLPEETARRLEEAESSGFDPAQRGATWTYLTTDEPFGAWSERVARGIVRKFRGY
jgi:hypothetical protein